MQQDLAYKFRQTIISSPKCRLVSFDFKSFHALTTGFEARDLDYMRICKLDIHSFLASYMVNEPADIKWSDSDLKIYLKEIKERFKDVRNKNAKCAILGWGFGMEGTRLYNENREIYLKKKDAFAAIELINNLFPKCARWREDIVNQAHKQGFLISRYGYLRWFWEAKRWDFIKQTWIEGEEADKAKAFLPSNDAHGHIKDAMLRLKEKGLLEEGKLVNQVHDDLIFDMSIRKTRKLIPLIKEEMERPNPVLVDEVSAPLGLTIKVEVKIGKNLAEMAEI